MRQLFIVFLIFSFVGSSLYVPQANADELNLPPMPRPGVMVHLSPEFTPAILKGIVIHPENAFKFDFIVYKGDRAFTESQKKEEYTKLIKYFLASLAVPDEDQWVNLSPYEKDRIIKNDFGKTEMGRDLLAQDYLLKQITASLIYPQDKLGRKFWDAVYARAYKEFGTTDIPVNTFNKVWIVPDNADIYEKGNVAYVYKSHLKVMLEEDYLSLQKHTAIPSNTVILSEAKDLKAPKDSSATPQNDTHTLASQIVRQIILPQLEKEVNEDKNFAPLRQVFSGMILAAWFKRALRESLLGKIYDNKGRVKGIDQDPKNNEAIYQRYLRAYKKGVFNYIQEDVDKYTNETIPRKYFSGGWDFVERDPTGKPIEGPDGFPEVAMTVNPPNAAIEEARDVEAAGDRLDEAMTTFDPFQRPAASAKALNPSAAMTAQELASLEGLFTNPTVTARVSNNSVFTISRGDAHYTLQFVSGGEYQPSLQNYSSIFITFPNEVIHEFRINGDFPHLDIDDVHSWKDLLKAAINKARQSIQALRDQIRAPHARRDQIILNTASLDSEAGYDERSLDRADVLSVLDVIEAQLKRKDPDRYTIAGARFGWIIFDPRMPPSSNLSSEVRARYSNMNLDLRVQIVNVLFRRIFPFWNNDNNHMRTLGDWRVGWASGKVYTQRFRNATEGLIYADIQKDMMDGIPSIRINIKNIPSRNEAMITPVATATKTTTGIEEILRNSANGKMYDNETTQYGRSFKIHEGGYIYSVVINRTVLHGKDIVTPLGKPGEYPVVKPALLPGPTIVKVSAGDIGDREFELPAEKIGIDYNKLAWRDIVSAIIERMDQASHAMTVQVPMRLAKGVMVDKIRTVNDKSRYLLFQNKGLTVTSTRNPEPEKFKTQVWVFDGDQFGIVGPFLYVVKGKQSNASEKVAIWSIKDNGLDRSGWDEIKYTTKAVTFKNPRVPEPIVEDGVLKVDDMHIIFPELAAEMKYPLKPWMPAVETAPAANHAMSSRSPYYDKHTALEDALGKVAKIRWDIGAVEETKTGHISKRSRNFYVGNFQIPDNDVTLIQIEGDTRPLYEANSAMTTQKKAREYLKVIINGKQPIIAVEGEQGSYGYLTFDRHALLSLEFIGSRSHPQTKLSFNYAGWKVEAINQGWPIHYSPYKVGESLKNDTFLLPLLKTGIWKSSPLVPGTIIDPDSRGALGDYEYTLMGKTWQVKGYQTYLNRYLRTGDYTIAIDRVVNRKGVKKGTNIFELALGVNDKRVMNKMLKSRGFLYMMDQVLQYARLQNSLEEVDKERKFELIRSLAINLSDEAYGSAAMTVGSRIQLALIGIGLTLMFYPPWMKKQAPNATTPYSVPYDSNGIVLSTNPLQPLLDQVNVYDFYSARTTMAGMSKDVLDRAKAIYGEGLLTKMQVDADAHRLDLVLGTLNDMSTDRFVTGDILGRARSIYDEMLGGPNKAMTSSRPQLARSVRENQITFKSVLDGVSRIDPLEQRSQILDLAKFYEQFLATLEGKISIDGVVNAYPQRNRLFIKTLVVTGWLSAYYNNLLLIKPLHSFIKKKYYLKKEDVTSEVQALNPWSSNQSILTDVDDMMNRAMTVARAKRLLLPLTLAAASLPAFAASKPAVEHRAPFAALRGPATPGGIDLNAINLNMHIKRDGNGVPLPVSQQDLKNIHIDGLVPVILEIRPATASPILSQLTGS